MTDGSTKMKQTKVHIEKGNGSSSGPSTRPKILKEQIFDKSYTWRLTDEEIRQKTFVLRYSTTDDCYYRLSSVEGAKPARKGWENGKYGSVNVQRFRYKSGNGQEWSCLTRKPGCTSASVSWWLDFRGSGMVIDDVIAYTYGKTLRNGRITFDLLSPDLVPSDDSLKSQLKRKSSLNGWQCLLLIAYLEGNATEVEDTQLFHHDVTDQPNFCPLDIAISLKPLDYLICTCSSSNKLPPISRVSSERINSQSCNTISGHRRTLSLRQPLRPVKICNQWTDTPPIPRKPVVIEIHPNRRNSEQSQLVAEVGHQLVSEVGSTNSKHRKSAPSRSRAGSKHRTHPGPGKAETTDSRFTNTIATYAMDDDAESPRGNIGGDSEVLQQRTSIQMIGTEEESHRPSSRCILL